MHCDARMSWLVIKLGRRPQAAEKYCIPSGSSSRDVCDASIALLVLPRARTRSTKQLSGLSRKPYDSAVWYVAVQVDGFTHAYQILASSKKAWMDASLLERSKLRESPTCNGFRFISTCIKIFGSYDRDTSSRILGHSSKCNVGVVCGLGGAIGSGRDSHPPLCASPYPSTVWLPFFNSMLSLLIMEPLGARNGSTRRPDSLIRAPKLD